MLSNQALPLTMVSGLTSASSKRKAGRLAECCRKNTAGASGCRALSQRTNAKPVPTTSRGEYGEAPPLTQDTGPTRAEDNRLAAGCAGQLLLRTLRWGQREWHRTTMQPPPRLPVSFVLVAPPRCLSGYCCTIMIFGSWGTKMAAAAPSSPAPTAGSVAASHDGGPEWEVRTKASFQSG